MERLRLYFFMFIVRLYYRIDTKKQCKSRKCLIYTVLSGERGSRTYEIIENHKISIRCKLSVYKIVKFIETHRVHFDI